MECGDSPGPSSGYGSCAGRGRALLLSMARARKAKRERESRPVAVVRPHFLDEEEQAWDHGRETQAERRQAALDCLVPTCRIHGNAVRTLIPGHLWALDRAPCE